MYVSLTARHTALLYFPVHAMLKNSLVGQLKLLTARHKGFLKDCPDGLLTEAGFIKIYTQVFYINDPSFAYQACPPKHLQDKCVFKTNRHDLPPEVRG